VKTFEWLFYVTSLTTKGVQCISCFWALSCG